MVSIFIGLDDLIESHIGYRFIIFNTTNDLNLFTPYSLVI